MQNPFDDSNDNSNDNITDRDKLIPTYITYNKKQKNHLCVNIKYIAISFIYLLEILTSVLGGLNNQQVKTFPNTNFKIQYWLLVSGLYNIVGIMCIYQFPLFKYENKLYFIIYDILKLLWLIIGSFILLNYNTIINCNFIIGYTLFYLIVSFVYLNYTFQKILGLKDFNL